MRFSRAAWRASWIAIGGIVVMLTAIAYYQREWWQQWLVGAAAEPAEGHHHDDHHAQDHDHGDANRLRLSKQARDNLRLIVKPISPGLYWRTIQIPGQVIERPGQGDRAVTAPTAGVVTRVLAVPGDTVRPGDALFTLRAVGEALQTAQSEFFKTARELEINRQQQERLAPLAKTSAIPPNRLLELEFQQQRLEATLDSARNELTIRGVSNEQIADIARGNFVTEITVFVPPPAPRATPANENRQGVVRTALESDANPLRPDTIPNYEIEQLRVELGEQVQSGQVLCHLASHQQLMIEGRGFKRDAHLLRRATEEAWPITAEFSEDADSPWPPIAGSLTIRHLAGVVDPSSQTFPFYIPLVNQSIDYQRGERKFRAWRFRPGQRVRLRIPVEKFDLVFVLPREAVVREGPDAYVFRQSGDVFERRAVAVKYEDRENVALAADGSLGTGQFIAHNVAAQLNRALKAQSAPPESHDYAGHSHEH